MIHPNRQIAGEQAQAIFGPTCVDALVPTGSLCVEHVSHVAEPLGASFLCRRRGRGYGRDVLAHPAEQLQVVKTTVEEVRGGGVTKRSRLAEAQVTQLARARRGE